MKGSKKHQGLAPLLRLHPSRPPSTATQTPHLSLSSRLTWPRSSPLLNSRPWSSTMILGGFGIGGLDLLVVCLVFLGEGAPSLAAWALSLSLRSWRSLSSDGVLWGIFNWEEDGRMGRGKGKEKGIVVIWLLWEFNWIRSINCFAWRMVKDWSVRRLEYV